MQAQQPSIDDHGRLHGIARARNRELEDGARFLQVQTLGSIVRNSFAIYRNNWRTISVIYITAMLPIALLHIFLLSGEQLGLAQIVSVIFSLIGLLIGVVVTVVISDLCLDVQPRVWRSYRRAFANIGRLIGTFLLLILLLFGGLFALGLAVFAPLVLSRSLVAALVAISIAMVVVLTLCLLMTTWFMFTLPVVVLEQLGGTAALKRSRALGKGSYLRNLGVVVLVAIPPAIAMWLLAYSLAAVVGAAIGVEPTRLMQGMAEILQILIVSPLLSIPGILLYYDMRARKDGYGAVQLAEELNI